MQWLTLEEVKQRYKVKDNRTIIKLMKNGLKYIKIGREYRFDLKDIEEFEQELKENQNEEIMKIHSPKERRKYHTVDFDYEKRKINLTQLKVV